MRLKTRALRVALTAPAAAGQETREGASGDSVKIGSAPGTTASATHLTGQAEYFVSWESLGEAIYVGHKIYRALPNQ